MNVDMLHIVTVLKHKGQNVVSCFFRAQIIVQTDILNFLKNAQVIHTVIVGSNAAVFIFRHDTLIVQDNFHNRSPAFPVYISLLITLNI